MVLSKLLQLLGETTTRAILKLHRHRTEDVMAMMPATVVIVTGEEVMMITVKEIDTEMEKVARAMDAVNQVMAMGTAETTAETTVEMTAGKTVEMTAGKTVETTMAATVMVEGKVVAVEIGKTEVLTGVVQIEVEIGTMATSEVEMMIEAEVAGMTEKEIEEVKEGVTRRSGVAKAEITAATMTRIVDEMATTAIEELTRSLPCGGQRMTSDAGTMTGAEGQEEQAAGAMKSPHLGEMIEVAREVALHQRTISAMRVGRTAAAEALAEQKCDLHLRATGPDRHHGVRARGRAGAACVSKSRTCPMTWTRAS